MLQHKSIIVVIQPPFWQTPVSGSTFLFTGFVDLKIYKMSDLQQHWEEAIQDLINYEQEIFAHNQTVIKDFNCEDLQSILEEVEITGKMEWSDKPKFKAEQNPDKYGMFTLEFVDQWSVGMEGDSFEGFMYIHIKGYDKYLKVPYSC